MGFSSYRLEMVVLGRNMKKPELGRDRNINCHPLPLALQVYKIGTFYVYACHLGIRLSMAAI